MTAPMPFTLKCVQNEVTSVLQNQQHMFGVRSLLVDEEVLLLLLLLRLFVTCKIPSRRPQMRCPAVRKCSCLYTMYHINNVFSCVLKVARLQSDIRNTVDKLFHTEGPETAKLLSP